MNECRITKIYRDRQAGHAYGGTNEIINVLIGRGLYDEEGTA